MSDIKELTRGRWLEILPKFDIDAGLLDGKHHAFSEIGCNTDGFRYIDQQGDGYCCLGNGEFGTGFDLLMKLNGWDFAKAASEIEAVMGWSDADYIPPTKEESATIEAKHAKAAAEREKALAEQHSLAAIEAQQLYEQAEPANAEHPYVILKRINLHGLYGIIRERDGKVIVFVSIDGKITSYQKIDGKGNKRFLKHGKITGGGCVLPGTDSTNATTIIFIGEGLATCCTVREATGQTVIVAFNAGNLQAVAESIRSRYPDCQIIIAGDNDSLKENTGEIKGRAAAEAVGGVFIMPAEPGDWNDYAILQGLDAARDAINRQINEAVQQADHVDHVVWTLTYTISDEAMARIADPVWVITNLIIEGHLMVFPAPPNGGKTTVMLYLSGLMAADGYRVFYVNADVSGSDAKSMHKQAKEHGFTLMLPDFHAGLSMADVVVQLKIMAEKDADYSKIVFIFDTLKKMTDVINKTQSKGLYKMLRSLSAKGMTVICLGHTNKYKGEDGHDVFEGCGDLRADVDEMIFFVPRKNADGSMTVSTRPDKVRGTFKPITFNISADREVSFADRFIDVGAQIHVDNQLEKDALEIEVISEVLAGEKLSQSEIVAACKALKVVSGTGKIIRVLKRWSEGAGQLWMAEAGGTFNRVVYTLIDQPDDEIGRVF